MCELYTRVLILISVVIIDPLFGADLPTVPVIPLVPDVVSDGFIYHVDNNKGLDMGGNGSKISPWRTIKYAFTKIEPGDRLIIHATSKPYSVEMWWLVNDGDKEKWTSIVGENDSEGRKVVIKGRIIFGNKYKTASYLLFKNVLLQGAGARGVNILINDKSHHIVLEDVEVDCQSSPNNIRGVWTADSVNHIWFNRVKVHHCGYQRSQSNSDDDVWKAPTDCGGICIKGRDVDKIVFLNVKVNDNVGDGISGGSQVKHGSTYYNGCVAENNSGDGIDTGAGQRTVIINSISRNNGGHQGVGYKMWARESWLIYSVAYNNDKAGLAVKPRHSGASNAYILNSTFALNNTGVYGGQITTAKKLPEKGQLNLYIHNNIFYTLNSSAVVLSDIERQNIIQESHNYYHLNLDKKSKMHWSGIYAVHFRNADQSVLKGYEFSDMSQGGKWNIETGQGAGGFGRVTYNDMLGDVFVNIEEPNLNLGRSSPAIDAGFDIGVKSDIRGLTVPIGEFPDMGAYEYYDTAARNIGK